MSETDLLSQSGQLATVVRCLVEVKHSKDISHLVGVVLDLTETLLQFDMK
jgi:hypothetical protein